MELLHAGIRVYYCVALHTCVYAFQCVRNDGRTGDLLYADVVLNVQKWLAAISEWQTFVQRFCICVHV